MYIYVHSDGTEEIREGNMMEDLERRKQEEKKKEHDWMRKHNREFEQKYAENLKKWRNGVG